MRKKLISVILLVVALSFLTYGIILGQYSLIGPTFTQMVNIIP